VTKGPVLNVRHLRFVVFAWRFHLSPPLGLDDPDPAFFPALGTEVNGIAEQQ